MITGIVVALPEELQTLVGKKLVKGESVYLNDQILVGYSGAGGENARVMAEKLVLQGADRLISWGCAGALSAELSPGDLVLTDKCVTYDGVLLKEVSEWLLHSQSILINKVNFHYGLLAESLQIVATTPEKEAFRQITGAIALDMESAAVARVAIVFDLPFLIVRAIADPLTMNLPDAVSYALCEQGEVKLTRLMRYLLLHPSEVSGLIKLGLHFNAAKNTLKHVARYLSFLVAESQSV